MLIENLGVVANQLLACEGVESSTDGVNRPGDVLRAAVCGSFEQHVLNEMGQAIFGATLNARASSNPNAERNGAKIRHCFAYDAHTIRQGRSFNLTGRSGNGERHR